MSFDVRAIGGDIEFGLNGDLIRVTDSDKLAQDVIKLLNTPIGSSPLNPGYGSSLTVEQIGDIPGVEGVIEQTKAIITQALEQLIAQQAAQATIQSLTDSETLIDFEAPLVERDEIDPRQYNIVVNAVSRDLTPLTIALVVRY